MYTETAGGVCDRLGAEPSESMAFAARMAR